MAGDSNVEEKVIKEVVEEKTETTNKKNKKKKQGLLSRIWNGLFRLHGDDFEKRLQHISKEEATILNRMKRRSSSWRTTARNIILSSVLLEVIAVGYAIMTTRSVDLDWKMRALRVLPMFVWPALATALYSGVGSLTKMRDRRDEKALERLRAERQAKIDELKERTNYYITQQLIQRYDPDPAAKAAAATVLASKLGADSGLKVFLADESHVNATGRSNDVQLAQSDGLRKRNQPESRSMGSNMQQPDKEVIPYPGNEASDIPQPSHVVVQHHNPAVASAQDGGWIARIAALLVGEDPTQSYALICGNCHMHNGLARKEDFPFITYYCPHCNALNKPRNSEERSLDSGMLDTRSSTTVAADVNLTKQNSGPLSERVSANLTKQSSGSTSQKVSADLTKQNSGSMSEKVAALAASPVAAALDESEASEKIVPEDPACH